MSFIDGMLDRGIPMKVFHFDTKEDFYQNMGQILKENDTILVKASHFMEFPEIVKKLSEEA